MPDDAISLIEQDHTQIRKLFEELAAVDDVDARRALFHDIRVLIEAHSEMEVEVLYPALRDAVGGHEAELLFHRSQLEHEVVDWISDNAAEEDPSSVEFLATFEVLRENLEHHMKVEEEVLLPRAREVLRGKELAELTERMDRVKQEHLEEVAEVLVGDAGEVRTPGA